MADDDPLDLHVQSSDADPAGVALVLDRLATFMDEMPGATRYEFDIEIQEVKSDD